MDRLTQLRERLAASIGPDGKAKPGYGLRVETLRVEIERLETARGATTQDPASPSSGQN